MIRGIELSLRAFASMRAVRLLLQARAVISFLMRTASTFEITGGERRALRKFLRQLESLFIETLSCACPSYLAGIFKTGDSMIRSCRSSTIPSSLRPIEPFAAKFFHFKFHESQWVDVKQDLKLSKVVFTRK